jgi:hypothetical protein
MKARLLDLVTLTRDLPEHDLHRGDIGTIVEVYDPDGLEVEFLDLLWNTRAVVTLNVDDVRAATEVELARREKQRAEELRHR